MILSNVIIIYFTSYYFVTTTMSRVGYGDYKAISDIEKCLCSIMMLCSFIVFGYLMDNEKNKKKTPKLQEILNFTRIDIENYIYNIDKTSQDRKLDP